MSEPFTEKIAAYFKARPGIWIDARDLEPIGGRQAWRTRVSDARRQFQLDIRNRTRRVRLADGSTYTKSEYAFFPKPEEFQLTA